MSIAMDEPYVDMLINNAALVGQRGPFQLIPPEVWADVVSTNVTAVVEVTRALLPLLRAPVSSTIMNIGSVMGRFARAGWAPYATTKYALEGLTQSLAQELFHRRIRVVALHPARINTALRGSVYGEEELFPKANLASLIQAIEWILRHPAAPVSGLSLSSDDIGTWSGDFTDGQ